MIKLLFPHSAVLITTQKVRTLVVADLHIGWEMALSKKCIHVPTQTPKLLDKLTHLLSAYKPEQLLILGDVKYAIATAEMGEWRDIPDFFGELEKRVPGIWIIRGNHDANLEPLLPEKVKLLPSTGTALGDVGFFHGHRWPAVALLKCRTLFMGHVHPVVAFRDPAGFRLTRQIWVKAKCDKTELSRIILQKHRIKIEGSPEQTLFRHFRFRPRVSQLFIMPSFNDFLGGRPMNEVRPRYRGKIETIPGPILHSKAVDMGKTETYLLDGTFLGTLEQLRSLS